MLYKCINAVNGAFEPEEIGYRCYACCVGMNGRYIVYLISPFVTSLAVGLLSRLARVATTTASPRRAS